MYAAGDKGFKLFCRLYSLAYHKRALKLTHVHDRSDHQALPCVFVEAGDKLPVEFDYLWVQVDNAFEVRITRSEVIDDKIDVPSFSDVTEYGYAKVIV
jgi:hypothetical protein